MPQVANESIRANKNYNQSLSAGQESNVLLLKQFELFRDHSITTETGGRYKLWLRDMVVVNNCGIYLLSVNLTIL